MSSARPAFRFVANFRITDHRPGHTADIRLTGSQYLLSDLRLIDPPGHEHRFRNPRLDGGRVRRHITRLHRHWRHDVNGPTQ